MVIAWAPEEGPRENGALPSILADRSLPRGVPSPQIAPHSCQKAPPIVSPADRAVSPSEHKRVATCSQVRLSVTRLRFVAVWNSLSKHGASGAMRGRTDRAYVDVGGRPADEAHRSLTAHERFRLVITVRSAACGSSLA